MYCFYIIKKREREEKNVKKEGKKKEREKRKFKRRKIEASSLRNVKIFYN